jgi:hypothetical protein
MQGGLRLAMFELFEEPEDFFRPGVRGLGGGLEEIEEIGKAGAGAVDVEVGEDEGVQEGG